MIGTDLNLDLPTLGGTIADLVSKTATALAAIEDSIADRATPAALNINASLELNGNALTEVTSVQFASGNLPTVAGSIYYSAGDWYVIDSVGPIKLTDNGNLNAAGVAGIVGDYGGTNPAAVSFDNASGEYRFTEDVGNYADLVAQNVVLNGASGSVRLSVGSIPTAREIKIESLPSTGTSLLVYQASDSTLRDSVSTQITAALDVVNFIATDISHRGQSARVGMNPATTLTNGGYTSDGGAYKFTATGDNWVWTCGSLPLITRDRITNFNIYLSTAVAGAITVELMKYGSSGASTIDTYVFNPGITPGLYSRTVASPSQLAATEYYFFRVSGVPSGIVIRSLGYTYDHPSP